MTKTLLSCLMLMCALGTPAFANEPITARGSWEGRVDFFMTGTVLAQDTDGDFRVDASAQPAAMTVQAGEVAGALEAAWIYWGGSQTQPVAGACTGGNDDQIQVGMPGGSVVAVTADECFCSDGGSFNYDVWVCRADMTVELVADGGNMAGTYLFSDYDGLFNNGPAHSASAALLLVYANNALPPRRVTAFDGNIDLFNVQEVVTLNNIDIDTIPSGDLTYYVLEGDISGGGAEQVTVQGRPGGSAIVLSDAVNPANNPFNQTINTTSPPQTGIVGVDVDRFDVTGALASMDTAVDITVSAGNDKVWLAATVIGVGLFDPAFSQKSTKSVALFLDVDNDGFASPGDTLRYTIRLENDGNETGTLNLIDTVPVEFASYTIVDTAGGTDVSTPTEVRLNGIAVAAAMSKEVVLDMVIGNVPGGTMVTNTASWTTPSQGGLAGMVTSVPTEIHDNPIVEPDMGVGMDAGADPDMSVEAPDMGNSDPDMGGTVSDMGERTPDLGRAFDDAGSRSDDAGSSPDGGTPPGSEGGARKSKEISSGCCATTHPKGMSGPWVLMGLAVLALRRRRSGW